MFMIEHILKQPSEVAGSQSVRVRFFSSVASPPWADFFVSCPHVHAEPVSGGGGRFVIWISAWCCLLLSIFKHHLIFFSSRWLAVGGLKSISVQMNFFFFLLCSFLSASDTWPPGICCVFSMQKLPASKQSTWTRMGRAGLKAGHRVNPLVTGSDIQVKWFLWLNRL